MDDGGGWIQSLNPKGSSQGKNPTNYEENKKDCVCKIPLGGVITPIISLSRCSIKHLYLFSALLLQVLLQIFHSSTYLLKKQKKPQTKRKASIYLLLSITQNGFESEKAHGRPSSAAWMQPMLSGVCSVWVRNSFSLISFLLAYQELDALKAKVPLLPAHLSLPCAFASHAQDYLFQDILSHFCSLLSYCLSTHLSVCCFQSKK